MAVRREVTVTLGHITDVRQQTSVLKNEIKTTTTYRPTEVTYQRSQDGDDRVPVTCGYPGCGKSLVVGVSGLAKARRQRRRLFLVCAAFLAGLVVDIMLLRAFVADAVGFLFILLALPLAGITLIIFGVAVSHVGDQHAKLPGHLVRVR